MQILGDRLTYLVLYSAVIYTASRYHLSTNPSEEGSTSVLYFLWCVLGYLVKAPLSMLSLLTSRFYLELLAFEQPSYTVLREEFLMFFGLLDFISNSMYTYFQVRGMIE